jgi:hypothetical protein
MDPGVSYLSGSIGRDESPEGAPDDRPDFLGGVRLPRPARPGAVLLRTARGDVAATIRTDGATVAATLLLDAISREKPPVPA